MRLVLDTNIYLSNFVFGGLTARVCPIPIICRDVKDNAILQLCEYIEADYLLTGDKDLLTLNNFNKTSILKPSAFVEVL